MRERLVTALVAVVSGVVFYLALEGGYALERGYKPSLSLTHQFLDGLRPAPVDAGPLAGYVHKRREIEERLPQFRRNGVVLGNSPFHDLASEEARVTVDDPTIGLRFKPNLTVRSAHLRSRIFKALDPLGYFYIVHENRPLEPELREFLAARELGELTWTTNADGFRTTLPPSAAERVVVTVGSSPCAGPYLTDDETLASVLQRRNPELRFINGCVYTTSVENHAAVTEEFVERLGDELTGVIYTIDERNYEEPEEALAAIDRMAVALDGVGARYRVLIYFHYIYETMPDLFRKHRELATSYRNKQVILQRARERGFAVVDLYDVVNDHRRAERSLNAGMTLYVDHGHMSREGNRILAAAVPRE